MANLRVCTVNEIDPANCGDHSESETKKKPTQAKQPNVSFYKKKPALSAETLVRD